MFDGSRRITNLANSSRGGLNEIVNVEPDIGISKVISRIYDEITTSELDELAAEYQFQWVQYIQNMIF